MRKRITSALLTLVMLLSLVPAMGTTAAAASESHPTAVNSFGNYDKMLGYYTSTVIEKPNSTSREVKMFAPNEIAGDTPEAKWTALTTTYTSKNVVGWIYYIPETGTLYIKGTIPTINFKAATADQDVLKVIVAGDATIERYILGEKLGGQYPGLKKMTIDFRNGSTLTLSKNTRSAKSAFLDITKTEGNAVRSYGDLELTGNGTLKIAPADRTPNVMFGIRANNISVSWWAQELPSDAEYAEAQKNLTLHDWQVDYIITHCAPTSIALAERCHNEADRLTDFLEEVRQRAEYRYWLFGHYHDNRMIDDKHILLWEQIVRII